MEVGERRSHSQHLASGYLPASIHEISIRPGPRGRDHNGRRLVGKLYGVRQADERLTARRALAVQFPNGQDIGAEFPELLEGLEFDNRANRNHCDHRADSNNNADQGQEAALFCGV